MGRRSRAKKLSRQQSGQVSLPAEGQIPSAPVTGGAEVARGDARLIAGGAPMASANLRLTSASDKVVAGLRTRDGWLTFGVVFVALVAWRWEILLSPPYWDSAMGLFLEANFLAESNFDYGRLAYQERRFSDGGPAVYVISVWPTVYAVLMRCLPSPRAVLLVGHLLNLAMGAGLLTQVGLLVRPWVGAMGALAAMLALATTPLLQVQMDMLGMDLPMACWALASVWMMTRRRHAAAALCSAMAFAIKLSGGLVTLAGAAYLAWQLAWSWRSESRRRRWWPGLMWFGLVLAAEILLASWKANLPGEGAERWTASLVGGWQSLLMMRQWAPDVLLLAICTTVGSCWGTAAIWRRGRMAVGKQEQGDRLAETSASSMRTALTDDGVATWLSAGIVLGMLAALLAAYTIPRYLTLPLAAMYVLLCWGWQAAIGWRSWMTVVLVLVTVVNVWNSDGRCYASLGREARTGAFLERSREYLTDHRENLALVALLEREYRETPIVAGNPLVHFLSLPRLGYVSRPLSGYALNAFANEWFQPVERLFEDAPADPILVYLENRFADVAYVSMPAPAAGDRVIYASGGKYPLMAYRLGGEHPSEGRDHEPGEAETVAQRRQRLIAWLKPGAGFRERGLRYWHEGKYQEAVAALQLSLRARPDDREARWLLAELALQVGAQDAAAEQYTAIEKLPPADLAEWSKLAGGWLALQRWADAERVLLRLTTSKPRDAEAWYQLGMARVNMGKASEGEATLKRVVELQTVHAMAHYQLGLLAAGRGERLAAKHHYAAAMAADDTLDEAVNNWAWLVATGNTLEMDEVARAVAGMEAVCQRRGEEPALADTLAACYAAAGRFEDAARVAEQASRKHVDLGNQLSADEVGRRLESYRARQRYQE